MGVFVLTTKTILYKHENLQHEARTKYYTKNHSIFIIKRFITDRGRRSTIPMTFPPEESLTTINRIVSGKNIEIISSALNKARNTLYCYIFMIHSLGDTSVFPKELADIIKRYICLTYRISRIKLSKYNSKKLSI